MATKTYHLPWHVVTPRVDPPVRSDAKEEDSVDRFCRIWLICVGLAASAWFGCAGIAVLIALGGD